MSAFQGKRRQLRSKTVSDDTQPESEVSEAIVSEATASAVANSLSELPKAVEAVEAVEATAEPEAKKLDDALLAKLNKWFLDMQANLPPRDVGVVQRLRKHVVSLHDVILEWKGK